MTSMVSLAAIEAARAQCAGRKQTLRCRIPSALRHAGRSSASIAAAAAIQPQMQQPLLSIAGERPRDDRAWRSHQAVEVRIVAGSGLL